MGIINHDTSQALETIAIWDVIAIGRAPVMYGSTISVFSKEDWQSSVLKESASVHKVRNHDELRHALHDPDALFILIPHDALVDDAAIERISAEAPFVKHIIREV